MLLNNNSFLFYLLCSFLTTVTQAQFFSKVIIWGHPLHSHTHSYIHWGFYRAFENVGCEVYWITKIDEIAGIDLHNALFITEGQVDEHIPKRDDCYYILHNCNRDNYLDLFRNNRCILLQVYTNDCLAYVTEKMDECMYCNTEEKLIFLPWATDLLPHEIDVMKKNVVQEKEPTVSWVGTIGAGIFGNINEITGFKKACEENNIIFEKHINMPMEKNIELIRKSYMAPAIQGSYQCEKGYIPCRIFKNISYGQWGITNNKMVHDLFRGKIIYNSDTYQLFDDAKAYIDNASINELYELMDFVKDNHTYINRIEMLLTFMKKALNIKEEHEVKQ